jgi:hypothetical protein
MMVDEMKRQDLLPIEVRYICRKSKGKTLHCIALHCTALHCTAMYCAAMYSIELYYTVVHCMYFTAHTVSYKSIKN